MQPLATTDQNPPSDTANDAALLSLEDELLSAMAEIESMKPGAEPAQPAITEPNPVEPGSDKPAEAAPKGLKFKIGKKGDGKPGEKTAKSRAAARPPAAESATPIEQITGALPYVSVFKRSVRGIDAMLEFAAAPMTILPPSVRKMVGILSIVTIAVSVGSATLLPLVLPYRDAVTFLSQRRSAMEAELHAHAAGETAGEAEGGHGEAKDKHGDAHEAKPEKKDDGHGASKKKEEKKPPKKDAKKKKSDKKAGGNGESGGHGGH